MMTTLATIEDGSLTNLSKLVREGEDLGRVQKWAKETREAIELRSPTSVKLSIKAIREGAKLNIEEVLAMDNRIAAACCVSLALSVNLSTMFPITQGPSVSFQSPEVHTDFRQGVTEFLINKIKPEDQKPSWSPSTLAEVTPESLQKTFFSQPAPFKNPPVATFRPSRKDRLNPLAPYKVHPYAVFSLPSEAKIEAVVKGESKDSPDYAVTRQEVIEKFERDYSGKVGVREKVEEVLDRRTVVAEENTLRWL